MDKRECFFVCLVEGGYWQPCIGRDGFVNIFRWRDAAEGYADLMDLDAYAICPLRVSNHMYVNGEPHVHSSKIRETDNGYVLVEDGTPATKKIPVPVERKRRLNLKRRPHL